MNLQTAQKTFALIAVFFCGACVMGLELLGPRLIAVYFGATIYSWTAIIGVTLLGLASGYELGGRWADKKADFQKLAWILLAAGVFTLLIAFLRTPVLIATRHMGLRLGALASSAILFIPVFLALGMVGPMCIRLNTCEADRIGRGAGSVFAISTVGSFLGTVATGFWLIPFLGVRVMLYAIALILGLLSAGGFVAAKTPLKGRSLAAPTAAGILILLAAGLLAGGRRTEVALQNGKIIHMTDSPYGQIKVVEKPPLRMLLVENGVQTHWNNRINQTQSPYVNYLHYLLMCRPGGKTMLNIGLGGGNVSKLFHDKHGLDVDVVEIDGKISEMAEKYFDVKPETVRNLIIDDGRAYLERNTEKYDYLVVDAFIGGTHPWQLLTLEAFTAMKKSLSENGILAFSLPGAERGPMGRVVKSVVKTLSLEFEHVRIFSQAPHKNEALYMLFASDGSLKPVKSPKDVAKTRMAESYCERLLTRDNITAKLDWRNAPVMTDDRNAVWLWEWRAVEWWRETMMASKGDPNLYLAF